MEITNQKTVGKTTKIKEAKSILAGLKANLPPEDYGGDITPESIKSCNTEWASKLATAQLLRRRPLLKLCTEMQTWIKTYIRRESGEGQAIVIKLMAAKTLLRSPKKKSEEIKPVAKVEEVKKESKPITSVNVKVNLKDDNSIVNAVNKAANSVIKQMNNKKPVAPKKKPVIKNNKKEPRYYNEKNMHKCKKCGRMTLGTNKDELCSVCKRSTGHKYFHEI